MPFHWLALWCPLIASRPIINWRKRVFVPTGERAAAVLAAVIGILG